MANNANRNLNSSKKNRNSESAFNPSANSASKKSLSKKSASSENWVESFSAPVTRVEQDIESFLTKEPLATVGIALGVGLVGGLLFKKYRAAPVVAPRSGKKSTANALSETAGLALAGFLTRGLTSMATRVESEFGAFRSGGITEIKDSLTQMITDELTEKPFETIATVVGAGFGIANLETSQVKDGAIRMAKGLAVRTLEASPSANKLGNNKETTMTTRKARSKAVNTRKIESTFDKIKTGALDILPEGKTVKSYAPAVLSVGAIVLGAVGIYALWKNRDKVEAYMDEHDLSIPSFVKDGIASVKENFSSSAKESDQVSAH